MDNQIQLSTRHNVERNCRIFHLTQHVYGNALYFADPFIAKARIQSSDMAAAKSGVVVMHLVIMPDHTHEIIMCENCEQLFTYLRSVNVSMTRIIRRRFPEEVASNGGRIFSSKPRYTPITDNRQYFQAVKYLFDNPSADPDLPHGFFYPYSSFVRYRAGVNPAGIDSVEHAKLFGVGIQGMLAQIELPNRDFMRKMYAHYADQTPQAAAMIFKIDPNKPYTVATTESESAFVD